MATNTQNNSSSIYTGLGLTSLTGISNNSVISSATTASFNTVQNASGTEIFRIPTDEATLDVKGRIKMNGEYLDERLERIETLLNIPIRDIEMENEFPKLKALWEEYNKELEKYKTWKRISE